MAEELKVAQHPLSQVPITFKRLRRENALDGNDSYEKIMVRRLAPVKPEIPDEYVHVTLKLAAMLFQFNDDFRTDLFMNSTTLIQGRGISSEGYFEILENQRTRAGIHTNWIFRPVDKYTFYNLPTEKRSFHLCGRIGGLYVDADPKRGLIVYTTPFHPDDLSIALARKSDLDPVIYGEQMSRGKAFVNTLKSALRRYL
jgi:hypothetical protein